MEFDEDPSQLHVVDKNFLTEQPEQGSYNPPVATTGGDMMQSISGPISVSCSPAQTIAWKVLLNSSHPQIVKFYCPYNTSRWTGIGAGKKTHF